VFGIATAGAYVMDRTSGLLWRKERSGAHAAPNAFDPPPLTDRDLQAIVKLVYEKAGITLHEGKRALITARLQKRLRETGARSFGEYLTVVEKDHTGSELVVLLDSIATNHTSFFREPEHFQFLTQKVVPEWVMGNPGAPLDVWSAACSSGEEPYTLAVALHDTLPNADKGRFRILASDLSTKVLRIAEQGVYKMERVEGIPIETLRRHFERGMGAQEGLARVNTTLRQRVEFRQLNLLEIGSLDRTFGVIFCRNVMIYFDRQVQQRVVSMLERHLRPGGYLFISHSESLNGVTHGLRWVAPAIYQRRTS
jgi:chemotaxis protein methyltransferase CheR